MFATIRKKTSMKDLAPEIYRQRAVIEGYPNQPLPPQAIKEYLSQLSDVLDMKTLVEPVTHRSPKYGEAAWIHWESSGAHFYAWDYPRLFFSVDIYTCKPFDIMDAVNFTKDYFQTKDIEYKEF
jgi:hypothetical protein